MQRRHAIIAAIALVALVLIPAAALASGPGGFGHRSPLDGKGFARGPADWAGNATAPNWTGGNCTGAGDCAGNAGCIGDRDLRPGPGAAARRRLPRERHRRPEPGPHPAARPQRCREPDRRHRDGPAPRPAGPRPPRPGPLGRLHPPLLFFQTLPSRDPVGRTPCTSARRAPSPWSSASVASPGLQDR